MDWGARCLSRDAMVVPAWAPLRGTTVEMGRPDNAGQAVPTSDAEADAPQAGSTVI